MVTRQTNAGGWNRQRRPNLAGSRRVIKTLVERAFDAGLRYGTATVPLPLHSLTQSVAPAAPPNEPTAFARWHWLALAAITALAAVLRFVGSGEWSLWVDEAHTWRDATMPLDRFLSEDRVQYPLPFLLLRGLLALGLGQDEGSLRLPFVVIGIVSVPLLGMCGRRLVGARAALFAALLLAVHPWHVYWSQNARGYVLVILAAIVTADRIHAHIRHDRLFDLGLAGLAIVVATLSHATGVLLAVGFVAFLVLRRVQIRRATLVWLAIGAAVAAYAVPWLIDVLPLFEGFKKSKDSPSLVHFVQTTGFYFRPMQLIAAAVGLWLLRRVGGRDRALLLGSMSAMPMLVLLAVGAQLVLTTARYAICALPMVTWLAAFAAVHVGRALATAPNWPRATARAAGVAVPLMLVAGLSSGLWDYYANQHGQRACWREAAAFLQERAAGRPLWVSTVNHPTMLYYLRPGQWANAVPPPFDANRVVPLLDWMFEQGQDEDKNPVHDAGAAAHVEWHRRSARANKALFAFVVTMPELIEQDKSSALRAEIARQCEQVAYFPCWVGPKDESIHIWVLKEP
jgi:hypothetical protein